MGMPRPKSTSGTATHERPTTSGAIPYTAKQAQYTWALRRLYGQARREKLTPDQQASLDSVGQWLRDADQALNRANAEQVAVIMPHFPISTDALMSLSNAIRRAPSQSALKGQASRRSKRAAEIAQAPEAHFSRIMRSLTLSSWAILLTLIILATTNVLELVYFRDVPRHLLIVLNLGGIVLVVCTWAIYHFRTIHHAIAQLYAHLSVHHLHDK